MSPSDRRRSPSDRSRKKPTRKKKPRQPTPGKVVSESRPAKTPTRLAKSSDIGANGDYEGGSELPVPLVRIKGQGRTLAGLGVPIDKHHWLTVAADGVSELTGSQRPRTSFRGTVVWRHERFSELALIRTPSLIDAPVVFDDLLGAGFSFDAECTAIVFEKRKAASSPCSVTCRFEPSSAGVTVDIDDEQGQAGWLAGAPILKDRRLVALGCEGGSALMVTSLRASSGFLAKIGRKPDGAVVRLRDRVTAHLRGESALSTELARHLEIAGDHGSENVARWLVEVAAADEVMTALCAAPAALTTSAQRLASILLPYFINWPAHIGESEDKSLVGKRRKIIRAPHYSAAEAVVAGIKDRACGLVLSADDVYVGAAALPHAARVVQQMDMDAPYEPWVTAIEPELARKLDFKHKVTREQLAEGARTRARLASLPNPKKAPVYLALLAETSSELDFLKELAAAVSKAFSWLEVYIIHAEPVREDKGWAMFYQYVRHIF